MKNIKVGSLPMYIKLYDDIWPELRKRIDEFLRTISMELENRGLELVIAPVCRVRSEFEAAVKEFENTGANAIVTLHLAYSPSLESANVLASTPLPVIILDTTPVFELSRLSDPDEVMYNHGIHGVQDMCNLLVRNGKPFLLAAGHWKESDVLDRIAVCVRSAVVAQSMKNARVGRIGKPFDGMGILQYLQVHCSRI